MSLVDSIAYVGGMVFAIGFPVAIIVGVLTAQRQFRSGSRGHVSSGLGAAMTEIDRLIRPSAEHVQQVKDEVVDGEKIDGE